MESHESCKVDLEIASQEASRLFVEIYEKLESRKVDPGIDFNALVEVFRESLKGEGVGLLEALKDFRTNVVPNCLAIPHPLYLGLVNSSPLPGAALADLLISALNNNDGGVPQAALACEQEVIQAFKKLYELPDSWNGLILPGGAFTTLQGLLLARASAFPDIESDGFHVLQGIPRIYTSEAAHFTVARAAKEIGVGELNVVCVPCLGRGSIDAQALEEHIRADRLKGNLSTSRISARAGYVTTVDGIHLSVVILSTSPYIISATCSSQSSILSTRRTSQLYRRRPRRGLDSTK